MWIIGFIGGFAVKEDYFKSYKYFKMIQLAVLVIFAVAFFCNLYFDKDLHSNIFTNRSLLTICIFLWAFMIYSLVSIIWDFRQLEGDIIHHSALHRAAYVDNLTGIPNRYSCDQIFEKYSPGVDISKMGCVLAAISNLSEINANEGRDKGNAILRDFSHILESTCKKYGFVGRNGGNDFLVVIEESDDEIMNELISNLGSAIEKYNNSESGHIEISTTYILNENAKTTDFAQLVAMLYKTSKRG